MIRKLLFFIFLLFFFSISNAQKPRVIIDSDTGNEIDDIPAIAHALMSNNFDVLAINATHWNRVENCESETMLESWILNNRILFHLNIDSIPNLKGAKEMVGRQWGIHPPRQSEASDFIIKSALEIPEGEKLIVITTGAATNVASAIMLSPEIVPKLAVYFIGTQYVFERKAFNKSEFNVRNDLNAFDVLLNTKDLELHILPATVCRGLVFTKEETFSRLMEKDGIAELFLERWNTVAPDEEQRVMWDIAIIQAVMHPEWVTEIVHPTPPENNPRDIFLYTSIDTTAMKQYFWEVFTTEQ